MTTFRSAALIWMQQVLFILLFDHSSWREATMSLLIPKQVENDLVVLNRLESLKAECVERLRELQGKLFGLIDDRMVLEMDIRRHVPELKAIIMDGLFCRTGSQDSDFEEGDILILVDGLRQGLSPAVQGRISQIRDCDSEIASVVEEMNQTRLELGALSSQIESLRRSAAASISTIILCGNPVTGP
ncbi:hypothetical protein AYO47_06220 [Planctomyces sp. SCGC AG-212-M04]|nr:hypothetical protein AYO47_06220 [Planctomyces sp. SCGC AG-212-M04]